MVWGAYKGSTHRLLGFVFFYAAASVVYFLKNSIVENKKFFVKDRWWLVTIALFGFIHAWHARHTMNPDGLAYLEMGEALFRGDRHAIINGYWSPLYPTLVGGFLLFVRPSPYWTFAAIHIFNVFIVLAAFATFRILVGELQMRLRVSPDSPIVRAYRFFAYSLFFVAAFNLITLARVTPDMLVAAFLFAGIAVALRLEREPKKYSYATLLGAVLGFGYLVKTPIFFIALFLFFVLLARRVPVSRIAASVFVFLVIVTPYIMSLSLSKGRVTIGDSGRLNYAWTVDGVKKYIHWQGGPESFGTPVHVSRILAESPTVYGFEDPFGSTYAPWRDPSYWFEGLQPHFIWVGQINNIYLQTGKLFDLHKWTLLPVLFGFLCLLVMRGISWGWMREVFRQWPIFLPMVGGLGMYLMVDVRDRYAGPFIILIWLGLYLSLLNHMQTSKGRIVSMFLRGVGVSLCVIVFLSSIRDTVGVGQWLLYGENPKDHPHMLIARELSRQGLADGDSVGVIGHHVAALGAYWAYLAKARIVAEIPEEGGPDFLLGTGQQQTDVLNAFRSVGATFVVMEGAPDKNIPPDWQSLGVAGYYAFKL